MQTSGGSRRENAKLYPRHCERSEAIHSFFVPRGGLLRFARNDVDGPRRAGYTACVGYRVQLGRHKILRPAAIGISPMPVTPM